MQKFSAYLPLGLLEALSHLIFTVIKEQLADFVEFASQFFQKVLETQVGKARYKGTTEEECNSSLNSLLESMEEMDEVDLQVKPKADFQSKSVVAEKINIEDLVDEDEMYVEIIPKTDDQQPRRGKVCKQVLLFKTLDEDKLGHVIDAMFKVKTIPGEKVIVQGDDGGNFYVIEQGVFDCFVKDGEQDKLVFTYKHEGYFGELALMYSAQRSARVEGILWGVDWKTLRTSVLAQIHCRKRMDNSDVCFDIVVNGHHHITYNVGYRRTNLTTNSDGEDRVNERNCARDRLTIELPAACKYCDSYLYLRLKFNKSFDVDESLQVDSDCVFKFECCFFKSSLASPAFSNSLPLITIDACNTKCMYKGVIMVATAITGDDSSFAPMENYEYWVII